MQCPSCMGEVFPGDAFCGDCGVRLPRDSGMGTRVSSIVAERPHSAVTRPSVKLVAAGEVAPNWLRPENLMRGGAAMLLVFAVFWIWYSGDAATWSFLLFPLILGALFPLARNSTLSARTEPLGDWLAERRIHTDKVTGRFSRFFLRPGFASACAVWTATRNVSDPHLRAGVRVAALLYLAEIGLGVLVVVGYILVLIVLMIVALIITFWVLSHVLSGASSKACGNCGSKEHATRDCPHDSGLFGLFGSKECAHCGSKNHATRDCPHD
jgi:hypothetical protein